jgi:hypothetical protein
VSPFEDGYRAGRYGPYILATERPLVVYEGLEKVEWWRGLRAGQEARETAERVGLGRGGSRELQRF